MRSSIINKDSVTDGCGFRVRSLTIYLYTCDECGFETTERCNITQHVSSHGNSNRLHSLMTNQNDEQNTSALSRTKKQFVCTLCGQIFVYEKNFNRHVHNAHSTGSILVNNVTDTISVDVANVSTSEDVTEPALNHINNETVLHSNDVTAEDLIQSVVCDSLVDDVTLEDINNGGIVAVKSENEEMTIVNWCEQVLGANEQPQILFLADSDHSQVAQVCHSTLPVIECPKMGSLPYTCRCNICNRQFVHKRSLEKHLARHAQETVAREELDCKHCNRVYSSIQGLRRHNMRFHNYPGKRVCTKPQAFRCIKCGCGFTRRENLFRHLRRGHPTVDHAFSYIVDSTSGVASNNTQENKKLTSQRWGSSARNFTCNLCGEQFFWKTSIRRHMLQKHSTSTTSVTSTGYGIPRLHKCPKCTRRFTCIYHLSQHLSAHAKVDGYSGVVVRRKPDVDAAPESASLDFLCSKCGAGFESPEQLNIHTEQHDPHKVYMCRVCSCTMQTVSSLRRHMARHDDQRLCYICEQCGHEAKSKSGFTHHMKHIHGGLPAPFACNLCSRRSWSARAARLHMNAHSVDGARKRKSMCSVCGMLFRHVFNLALHIKSTHTDNFSHPMPFSCATCHEQFTSGDTLKAHYHSKHRSR